MRAPIAKATNDQDLVKNYIRGEERALTILINRHKAKVFTSIMMFMRNKMLAEDVFQETFIKVVETLRSGKYKEEGKFLPWVMRISYNLCIDHFRKVKRTPTITNTDGFDIFNVLKFAEGTVEDEMIANHTYSKVRELIDMLPDEQKEVVILRHYSDLSFKEIADLSGVSINTALGRMRYALINMRKMMVEKQFLA